MQEIVELRQAVMVYDIPSSFYACIAMIVYFDWIRCDLTVMALLPISAIDKSIKCG